MPLDPRHTPAVRDVVRQMQHGALIVNYSVGPALVKNGDFSRCQKISGATWKRLMTLRGELVERKSDNDWPYETYMLTRLGECIRWGNATHPRIYLWSSVNILLRAMTKEESDFCLGQGFEPGLQLPNEAWAKGNDYQRMTAAYIMANKDQFTPVPAKLLGNVLEELLGD
jgi:hypothetical protein